MSDPKYAANDLASAIGDILLETFKTLREEAPAKANPNVVNMSMTREAFEEQRAKLAAYDRMTSELKAARDEIVALNKRVAAAESDRDDAKRNYAALNHQYEKLDASHRSLQASAALVPTLNKLRKDFNACKNQRDSYARTIKELRSQINVLEGRLETTTNSVNLAVVDGQPWTPDMIRQQTALVQQLQEHTIDSNKLVNELHEKLKKAEADLVTLRKTASVYTFHGRVLSPERITALVEKGIAVEQSMEKVMCQKDPTTPENREVINIQHPEATRLKLAYGHQTIELDADLIPVMYFDLQGKQNQLNSMETANKALSERNTTQANSIRAQDDELERRRKRIVELEQSLSQAQAELRTRSIEANLLRGRAKVATFKANEAAQPETCKINGTPVQAGEAYMTTAIGLLPINSTGMRKLSDALDSYAARVQKLRAGLKEWIKE